MNPQRADDNLAGLFPDLSQYTPDSLLVLYALVMKELRNRGIVRSFNNPVGDLGEHIVCQALGLDLAGRSVKGYDATSHDGLKYQIKARWHGARGWRNIVGLRDLEDRLFDRLAIVVLHAEDYGAELLFHFPYEVVMEYVKDTTRGFKRIALTRELLHDPRIAWTVGSPSVRPSGFSEADGSGGVGPILPDESGSRSRRIPLHEVVRQVLVAAHKTPLPIPEVYHRILAQDLYRQLDGSPVSQQQVYARIRNYEHIFVVDRSKKPAVVSIRE